MVKKLVKKSDNLCRSANYNILIQDNEDEKLRPTRDQPIMIIVIYRGFDSDYYQNHLSNKL